MKAGVKKPAINYASAVKGIRLTILPKKFLGQILAREDQEIIEDLVVRQMFKQWTVKLLFTGIRFPPGYILVNCVTEDTADWLRTIVSKLTG